MFGRRLAYQCAYRSCRSADLVLLQQQNNLLFNYQIQVKRRLLSQRIAFVGHGRNFQSNDTNGVAERFKRMWSRRADWWFAYTERCARIVERFGFPSERITVFNNAIDINGMQAERASITAQEITELRDRMFGGSRNVGLYVGGLYPEKRTGFLLEAAAQVRSQISDFNLIVIGGGPDSGDVTAAAARSPWIHFLGPKFGREKALYAAASQVLLMPGLVGLGVLDSFAYRTPLITTDYPFHSPEVDYLKHDENGWMVRPYMDVRAYSDAIVALLQDDSLHARLVRGAEASAREFTIEAMVTRFAEGIMRALQAPPK
jgi:glycosyltransferase involved in cell wall biosynthesis